MTPTPPSHSSFQSHFRFRRSRTANSYQQPTQVAQTPVAPLPDFDDDGGVNNALGAREVDDQDEDVDIEDHEIEEEEGHEVEEEGEEEDEDEEGGIEEGSTIIVIPITRRHSSHNLVIPPAQVCLERLRRLPSHPTFALSMNSHEAWLRAVQRADDDTTVPMEIDAPFDPDALGLKEIGNLASWTVSTCKPGCGVEALRDDDTGLFWQSDGPQPHHLNIHFSRLVSILSIRIYLDFEADESYTPTRITLLAGTGYHDLIPFASLDFAQPKGWIDVPLDEVGGGEDGKTLRAFLVQVKVVENHQNGKDTHVRGLKVYAKDERVKGGLSEKEVLEVVGKKKAKGRVNREPVAEADSGWLVEEDWMGEPELR